MDSRCVIVTYSALQEKLVFLNFVFSRVNAFNKYLILPTHFCVLVTAYKFDPLELSFFLWESLLMT